MKCPLCGLRSYNHLRGGESCMLTQIAGLERQLAAANERAGELERAVLEERSARMATERRLDEVTNAKSALENVACLEDKWVAVEGGGFHRAVSPDRLGDLYDRLRRAEGRKL